MSKRHSKSTALTRVSRELFKRYKWQLILIVFCILLSCAGSISSSIFIASLVDDYLEPLISSAVSGAEYSFIPMLKFVGSMSCIFAAAIISSFIYTRLMGIVTQHFLADIRNTMFGKMQTLPIRYFDTTKTGDIMSVYTNDVDALRQMIGSSFPQLISSSVTIISAVVLMLYYSIWLSLVVVVAVAAMTLISRHIAGHSVRYFIKQQQAMGSVDGYIEESLSGQKVIKVFCHEKEAKAAFDKVNNELFKATESANKYSNILMPILGNIGNLLYVVLALVGASLFLSGASNVSLRGLEPLSIGVVVAFLSMSKMFTQQVGMVSQQVNSIAMGIAGAQRIFDLIDETPEQDEGYVTLVNAKYDDNGNLTESETRTGIWAWKHYHKADDTTTYQLLQGDIYIENMDFGYNPDKLVLKDISLYAKPGQKVAFVGATGAGKTTITNLLNRFYDIDDGKIRYDGININKIKKGDLRRSLGMVLQDTDLFAGTVRDNIRYGRPDATDEQVEAAAKQLEQRVRQFAKDIHTKYIHVPETTDFGIMFLPVEGLYAEVVRRGMVDRLQTEFKVIVAGPTTMAALLNSLQMGFRTLAIQKRSGEVWNVLSAVKQEFETFGTALVQTQKRLNQASDDLEKLVGVRTRQIQRRLRSVTALPEEQADALLEEE